MNQHHIPHPSLRSSLMTKHNLLSSLISMSKFRLMPASCNGHFMLPFRGDCYKEYSNYTPPAELNMHTAHGV